MKSKKLTEPPENTGKESLPPKEDTEYEDAVMIAYQKKEPGEWEKVEIHYRRKKNK